MLFVNNNNLYEWKHRDILGSDFYCSWRILIIFLSQRQSLLKNVILKQMFYHDFYEDFWIFLCEHFCSYELLYYRILIVMRHKVQMSWEYCVIYCWKRRRHAFEFRVPTMKVNFVICIISFLSREMLNGYDDGTRHEEDIRF